jgi:hypothetical protein
MIDVMLAATAWNNLRSHNRGNMTAFFANSVAKEADHDHGRSGKQVVPVAPRG